MTPSRHHSSAKTKTVAPLFSAADVEAARRKVFGRLRDQLPDEKKRLEKKMSAALDLGSVPIYAENVLGFLHYAALADQMRKGGNAQAALEFYNILERSLSQGPMSEYFGHAQGLERYVGLVAPVLQATLEQQERYRELGAAERWRLRGSVSDQSGHYRNAMGGKVELPLPHTIYNGRGRLLHQEGLLVVAAQDYDAALRWAGGNSARSWEGMGDVVVGNPHPKSVELARLLEGGVETHDLIVAAFKYTIARDIIFEKEGESPRYERVIAKLEAVALMLR